MAVLAAGVLARVVLMPLSHGQDYVVWNDATRASLHGVNIYTHHPAYPGGPILGKLPIFVADVATALLIAEAAIAYGARQRGAVPWCCSATNVDTG